MLGLAGTDPNQLAGTHHNQLEDDQLEDVQPHAIERNGEFARGLREISPIAAPRRATSNPVPSLQRVYHSDQSTQTQVTPRLLWFKLRRAMPRFLPPLPVLLPTFLALGLLFSPTWGILDYHASLALAPLMGLCALQLAGKKQDSWRHLALLGLLPLLILLLASLWLPNCNRLYGLGFYALGPLSSLLVGLGYGRLGLLIWPAQPLRLAYALALLSTLVPLAHFLLQPQVFAYHGLVGYVAGALYEDAVAIQTPYLLFRLFDILLWLPVIFLPRPRWTLGLGLAQLALAVTLFFAANTQEWRIQTTEIQQTLRREVQHDQQFVAHLPDTLLVDHNLALWIRDIAFRYAELQDAFGTRPQQPIDLYFYRDAGQKQRLMGANRVDMAKPWLRQVHMVLPEFGSTTLTHELAHVFAAQWAQTPLGIPLRHALIPDAVAIEGLAVAMEWPVRGNLDPHQWTRAMRMHKLAPTPTQLWSLTGFLGQQSDRAYTVAGSFLRWLGQTRGWPQVARVYAGEPLEEVTGQPLKSLELEWNRFVDDENLHPLTELDLARAQLRFARPGLFEKPCALEIGRSCQRADRLAALGKPNRAVAVRKKLLTALEKWIDRGMDDPDLHLDLADDLAQSGNLQAALEELTELRARTGQHRLHPLLLALVESAQADLLWRQGKIGEAEAIWRDLLRQPLAEPQLRTLEVKLHFSRIGVAKNAMENLWLTGQKPQPGGTDPLLEALFLALPEDAIAQSLWARRLLVRGEVGKALQMLENSALHLEVPYTARESARQLVWRQILDPQLQAVTVLTRMLAESAVPPATREEWLRREAFNRSRAIP